MKEGIKNDFVGILVEAKNGAIANDISEHFDEVIAAIRQYGGSGTLTVVFDINTVRADMGVVLEVEISHNVKIKKPKRNLGSGRFYMDDEGKLVRDDPAQEKLFDTKEETDVRRPQ